MRPADPIVIVTRSAVQWPPEHLRDSTLEWLGRLLVSEAPAVQVGQPPPDLGALADRLRIAPFTQRFKHHGPGSAGLWWHENVERRPVIVERLRVEDAQEYLRAQCDSVDNIMDEASGDGGVARDWLLPILRGAQDVVGINIYSGDQNGPGWLSSLALAAAIAIESDGVIDVHDQWYEVGDDLRLRAFLG